ncbi:hypothetical protein AC1031_003834 [Aphanomyces cochlioides]|nr:hypothetical protein AC1031_003834 [Aphanomyces cochlioides]
MEHPARRCPADVVMMIGSYIAKPKHLFTYLEALRPANLLGPLEHLWQLGLVKKHSDVWPSLVLWNDDVAFDSNVLTSLQAFAKYYKVVEVHDIDNLQYLNPQYFDPSTEWHMYSNTTRMIDTWQEWTSFRVTRWQWTLCRNALDLARSSFLAALPQLSYLSSLSLMVQGSTLLDAVLAFASNSRELIELRLDCFLTQRLSVTTEMLQNVIRWFERKPVRMFKFSSWNTRPTDPAVRQTFYRVVFGCPTLDELVCLWTDLNDMDFTNLQLHMRSLVLHRCNLGSDNLSALSDRLPGSTMTHLAVKALENDNFSGLERLLQVLPSSSIKDLDLSGSYIEQAAWFSLAPLLSSCRLESLVLVNTSLFSDQIELIARAIQDNGTISRLDCSKNPLDVQGARCLIESTTHSTRPIHMRLLYLIDSFNIPHSGRDELKQLADQRGLKHFYI